jgi:hypothetical protein
MKSWRETFSPRMTLEAILRFMGFLESRAKSLRLEARGWKPGGVSR